MSDPIFWSDVKIEVGKTHATALAIVSISKANPPVVVYTGTDPTDGQFVIMNVAGMTELTKRVMRIANVDSGANSFELEGEDSTEYGTFTSGTVTPVTDYESMTTVQDIDASGGEPEEADTTTVHDKIRSVGFTVFSPSKYSFGCLFDAADAAMKRIIALSKKKAFEAYVFTFSDGSQFSFYGAAAASGAPTGSAQQVVKTNVAVTARGVPNVYAAA